MERHELLIALAERADRICAQGWYARDDTTRVDLGTLLNVSLRDTLLMDPTMWTLIEHVAHERCLSRDGELGTVHVTGESTLAALQRLRVDEGRSNVAALNFASARNPGGGYRNGATAQEESLARASGLVRTLKHCWTYYEQNRREESLLYTDHAIWSPAVPFFATDDGTLLPQPYTAGVITMPAPNTGAMRSEADLLRVIPTFRRRIQAVLALAVVQRVDHLILGAWGCGAFGNQPDLVAKLFRDALAEDQPWRRALSSVTFAIIDTSKRRASFAAFQTALILLTVPDHA